jgi:hypothetical protein
MNAHIARCISEMVCCAGFRLIFKENYHICHIGMQGTGESLGFVSQDKASLDQVRNFTQKPSLVIQLREAALLFSMNRRRKSVKDTEERRERERFLSHRFPMLKLTHWPIFPRSDICSGLTWTDVFFMLPAK